jgi:hypothetical protein
VVFGLPLCLFPWGVHLRAILVILDTGILRTCPSHLKHLCCISLRTHVEVSMRFYHSPGLQIYICTLFVETVFKKNWLNALAIGSCVNYVLQWHSSWISSVRVRVMVFNTTFSNISAISWQSVLLVEETGVPRENHRPVASHWQTLLHNVLSSTPPWVGFKLTTLVVIVTDCICSCKSNYHTITILDF